MPASLVAERRQYWAVHAAEKSNTSAASLFVRALGRARIKLSPLRLFISGVEEKLLHGPALIADAESVIVATHKMALYI